jgi:hypothetical protein
VRFAGRRIGRGQAAKEINDDRLQSRRTEDQETSSRLLGLAFVAGFLAVPLFHQPTLALLHAIGLTSAVPYVTSPTPPLGVPRLLSQAFWGGVWGIVFALVAPRFPRGIAYWITAVLFGALALSIVAWFIVAPLKGLPAAGGGRPAAIATALLVNGAWGFGTALLLLAFRKVVEEGRIT